jgi:hypothetical protein
MLHFKAPRIPDHSDIPKKAVAIRMPQSHETEILRLAKVYASQARVYGYRYTSQLSGLIRGRALSQGRVETNDDDMTFLWSLQEFSNPEVPFKM